MGKRRRVIVAVLVVLVASLMALYAGQNAQNTPIATRTVTFLDGTTELSKQEIEVGKEAEAPTEPDHENLVFVGWYTEDDLRVTDFTNIRENLTVEARYASDLNNNGIADTDDDYYQVRFVDSITNSTISNQSILTGMNASTPSVPNHENYTFTHWSTGYTNVTRNLTVNAMYILNQVVTPDTPEEQIIYKVTFFDGHTNEILKEENVVSGENTSSPSQKTYENKVFLGWFDQNNVPFTNSTSITAQTTVTALYADDLNNNNIADSQETRYKVTFASENEERLLLTGTKEYTNLLSGLLLEDVATPPEVTELNGFEFTGWDPLLPEYVDSADRLYTAMYKDIHKPEVKIIEVDSYNAETFKVVAEDNDTITRIDYSLWTNKNTKQLGVWGTFTSTKSLEIVQDFYKKSGVTSFLKDLSEGEYTLRATVKDAAGHVVHADDVNFKVDHTGPTITVKDGSIGLEVNKVFSNVSFKLFDQNNIDYLTLNGVLKDLSNNNWSDLNYVKPGTFGAVEGENTLIVYDEAGNSSTYVFTLDTVKPIAKITTPENDNMHFKNDVTVKVEMDSSEKHPLGHWIEITNPDGTLSYNTNMPTWDLTHEFKLDTSFGDGEYIIRYVAKDRAGNSSTDVYRTLTVDTTGPIAIWKSPADKSVLNKTVRFEFEITDVSGVESAWVTLLFNNTKTEGENKHHLIRGEGNIWYADVDFSSFKSGEYTVNVRSQDILGNARSQSNQGSIIIDNNAPTVSNVKIEPIINENIGGTVTVYFDLEDETGINFDKTYVIFADGPNKPRQALESAKHKPELIEGNSYKVVINTKEFLYQNYAANYNLQFTMEDTLGNRTSTKPKEFRPILIDNSGPLAELISPLSGSEIVRGTVEFQLRLTEDTGVKTSSLTLTHEDGTKRSYALTHKENDIWSVLVDTTEFPYGKYVVSTRSVDLFGTPRSSTLDDAYVVLADKSAPTVSNVTIEPIINENIGGTVTVYFDLEDETGINFDKTYVIFADGPNKPRQALESAKHKPELIEGNSYKVVINTKSFLNENYVANYNLQFTMEDTLGNRTSTKPKEFRPILIDNSGPSAELIAPLEETISGIQTFKFRFDDHTGTKSAYMKLVGEVEKTLTLTEDKENNLWYAEYDVSELPNGTYSIHVRPTDLFGTPRYNSTLGKYIVETPTENPEPYRLSLNYLNYKRDNGTEQAWKTGTSKTNPTTTMDLRFKIISSNGVGEVRVLWSNEYKNYYPIQDALLADPTLGTLLTPHADGFYRTTSPEDIEGRYLAAVYFTDQKGNVNVFSGYEMWFKKLEIVYPTASVSYSDVDSSGNVTATLTANKELKPIEGWTSDDYLVFTRTYETNVSEEVKLVDLEGNTGSALVEINNILPILLDYHVEYTSFNTPLYITLNFNQRVSVTSNGFKIWIPLNGDATIHNFKLYSSEWGTTNILDIVKTITFTNRYGKVGTANIEYLSEVTSDVEEVYEETFGELIEE